MAASVTSSAAVIGSTGLVGSFILSNLLAAEAIAPIHTITRRAPKSSSPKLNAVIDTDTTKWASAFSSFSPVPHAAYSALGTTRAAAGGVDAQWKIDHDLNVELAKAAKEAGVKTFVFISSAGTSGVFADWAPYSKMKQGVEKTIKELDFDHGIIVRPGLIIGQREEHRFSEGLIQTAVRGLFTGVRDKLGQDAEVIARAAIRAAQLADEGKAPSKYWTLEQSDIIRLGRTEWAQSSEEEK